ncbi:hypothetical protein CV102_22520 [Natronococcus pandeyae]|uniref:Uncharacterized protein n=1 Tax=Natronococcus pandeyae TaxID=2055836 RepID=A0A8J8PZS9_9EURY|nr:hypothetical protein CV102_22520 [Natronococcus pandeyae]
MQYRSRQNVGQGLYVRSKQQINFNDYHSDRYVQLAQYGRLRTIAVKDEYLAIGEIERGGMSPQSVPSTATASPTIACPEIVRSNRCTEHFLRTWTLSPQVR